MPPQTAVTAVDCLRSSLRFLSENRNDFRALAFGPMLVLVAGHLCAHLIAPELFTLEDGGDPANRTLQISGRALVTALGIGLFDLTVLSVFAVAWHRRYLRPDENPTVREALRWRGRTGRYLGRVLALVFGAAVVSGFLSQLLALLGAALGPLVAILQLALMIAVPYWAVRFSLLLPAVAVDDVLRPRQGLELSRGIGWQLLLIFMLAAFAAIVAVLVLVAPITLIFHGVGLPLIGFALSDLAGAGVQLLITAAVVGALSHAYRLRSAPPPTIV